MHIRKSTYEDLPRLMEIYREAQRKMIVSGNLHQWAEGHPTEAMIRSDIDLGVNHAVVEDGRVVGAFSLFFGKDPTYSVIEGGAWVDDVRPYATIHRIGSCNEARGVAEYVFSWCLGRIRNLRIDTHEDNVIMRHCVEKAGFRYCGVIHLANGDPRLAYQKVLPPLVMGIINATPDSFWERSRDNTAIHESGADIIDIGAVSTRPGAADVDEEEEWARLEPVLRLAKGFPHISIDTTRSSIVRRACELIGPVIVNDISAGEDDPDMLRTAAELGLPFIAMHKRGGPRTMDSLTDYADDGSGLPPVVAGVRQYFRDFAIRAEEAGIRHWIADPGFGFAKTTEQNLELLDHLDILKDEGWPVLAGVADKRFTQGRTEECHATAITHGADILRVHDVEAARRTIESLEKTYLEESSR